VTKLGRGDHDHSVTDSDVKIERTSRESKDGPRRQNGSAQKRKRSLLISFLTTFVVTLAVGLATVAAWADIVGTPRIAVLVSHKTNVATFSLLSGKGPLAAYLFNQTNLRISFQNGKQVYRSHWLQKYRITNGTKVNYSATLSGPLLRKPTLNSVVHLPVAPVITNKSLGLSTETIDFNTPISSISTLDHGVVVSHTTMQAVLNRSVQRAQTVHLTLNAIDGESHQVTVKIPSVPTAKEYWFGTTAGRHIYITMDDGWYPNQKIVDLMKAKHIPITTFLIADAAKAHLEFWKQFVAAGGDIEDHTVSHPALTRVPASAVVQQWQQAADDFQQWFGTRPTLGRPPYGDINQTVREAAARAGINRIVMWSANFEPGKPNKPLQNWNGRPLQPGEIVLLHWQPGDYKQLQEILAMCTQYHLVPALLKQGLQGAIASATGK
jgi:peptidoglycan/xylan/chitin deacetylase (PgdA/CDA1 family)